MDNLFGTIRQKIQLIGQNLGTNNGFISRIKNELTGIRAKLNQVVQTRAAFQESLNQKQKAIDDLTKRNGILGNTVRDIQQQREAADRQVKQLQGEIQNAQNISKKMQQDLANANIKSELINRQLSEAKNAASQNQAQIVQMTREREGLEQTIGALDTQISQIATVVSTQTRMLDPNNREDPQNNLFTHITGINNILNEILNSPPGLNQGSGPSPDFGNRGSPGGAGGNPNGGYSDFGSGSGFPPGGAGGNPDGSPGSDIGNNLLRRNDSGPGSDSEINLGGPGFGQNQNNQRRLGPDSPPLLPGQNPVPINPRVFPGPNFNNGNNIYQQPQVRPPSGGRKTRRKRRNKKTKKGGRKSMHKRARSKK